MRKTAAAAVLATAMVLLSGCSQTNPSVAAYVGSDQIPVSEVDAVAKVVAANATQPTTWGEQRPTVVQVAVTSQLGKQVVAKLGITITDEQLQTVYASSKIFQALAADPATAGFMHDYAVVKVVAQNATAAEEYRTLANSETVVVNPVFGTWDKTTGLTGDTGSLSQEQS